MPLANLKPHHLTAVATTLFLFACGGGSGSPVETVADPVVTATPTPTPTPAPSPPTPSPTPNPTVCTASPIGSTGYSLVFKGCSVANAAEYYDKTECVRDNATGLIWEGKPIIGFRTYQYTNFDNISVLQKWIPPNGPAIAPTNVDLYDENNSLGFRNIVNSSSLCGFGNWRLPTRFELEGLVKPSQSPKIDNTWFPNTGTSGLYWTSTADLENYNGTGVNFFDGTSGSGFRTLLNYVRLVR